MSIWTRTAAATLMFALLSPQAFAEESKGASNLDARIATARASVKQLATDLKKHLKAALETAGPVHALPVCKTIAPALARSLSTNGSFTIRRTALKLRNPDNAPDDFERRVLEMFDKKIKAGEPAAKMEYSEVVEAGGKKLFRYMKAIPTAKKPCLACHGSKITARVREHIKELYPQDQATGFKAGDLRGAFSVTQTIREDEKTNQ